MKIKDSFINKIVSFSGRIQDKIDRVGSRIEELEDKHLLLTSRIDKLERENLYLHKRVHNHRWFAIEELGGYLVGAQLPGDYCEFGVYKGDTFGHCLRVCAPALPDMRYFAFDSFQGLPEPSGVDSKDGYTSNFSEGEFACSEEDFLNNLKKSVNNINVLDLIGEDVGKFILKVDKRNKDDVKKFLGKMNYKNEVFDDNMSSTFYF